MKVKMKTFQEENEKQGNDDILGGILIAEGEEK